MGDTVTYNSRTDKPRIFRVDEGVDHVTH